MTRNTEITIEEGSTVGAGLNLSSFSRAERACSC